MLSARGLVLVLLAACNSDFPILMSSGDASTSTGQLPTTTGGASTTSDDTTSSSSSSSSSSSESSSEGESTAAPPEQTCRDVLDCVAMCALNFNLECFQACTENVSPEEGQKALALGGCIAQGCFTSGKCTPETLMELSCLGCLGLGLLNPKPEGCEDQAEACT